MANKIRLGFVGANVNSTWPAQSHFPALLASPDVEFTATCTTRPESAEEARQAFGAKLAFHDFRAMVVSPEIDALAVVVRVPSHYEATKAAIEAGKHVYTEWPLGRNTAEAEELAALARDKGVQTAVGLQSRVSPTLLYIKEQIEAGYVGEVLSCHVTTMRAGALERPSSRTWQRDASLGANTLTTANGHVIDALRFRGRQLHPGGVHGQHPGKAIVRDRYPAVCSCHIPGQCTKSADSWRAARQLPRVLPDQHRVGAGYTKILQRLLHESCQMLKPASNARIELVWRVDLLCQILPGISLHPPAPRPQ